MLRKSVFGVLLLSAMAQAETVLYSNATLVYPHLNQKQPNSYMLIRDGRFVSVGTGLPPEHEVHSEINRHVDLQEKFVVAGFIDTHAHINLGAVSYRIDGESVLFSANNSLDVASWNAEKLLQYGVTSIRNPGGHTDSNLAYKHAQLRGEITGPRAFVAGSILHTEAFDGLVDAVTDDNAINQAIDSQVASGVDYIKLYTGLNQSQLTVAVKRAQSHHRPVLAHLEDVSWTDAASIGVDHLVHAMPVSPDLISEESRSRYLNSRRSGSFNWIDWYQHAVIDSPQLTNMAKQLVQNNVAIDPTLIVFFNAFFGNDEHVTQHHALTLVHPQLLENWKTFYHFNVGWQPDDFELAARVWPKVLNFVSLLHKQGVTLSIGTDLGNPWVIPGVSFHQEMKLMRDAGLSNMEVLDLATRKGAIVLGKQDQLGQIAPGLLADFVVLNHDPSQNIEHAADIYMVCQNGNVVYQPKT